MKWLVALMFLGSVTTSAVAQRGALSAAPAPALLSEGTAKPPLDTTAFGRWPLVASAGISNDGRYAWYAIRDQPIAGATLVVRAVNGKWQREIAGASTAILSADSKRAIYMASSDRLCLLVLGGEAECFSQVRSFQVFTQGRIEWLAYQRSTPGQELVLRNLTSGREQVYPGVLSYTLIAGGTGMVLQTIMSPNAVRQTTAAVQQESDRQQLHWVTLPGGKHQIIWEGFQAGSLTLDAQGRGLAFVTNAGGDGTAAKAIWYYRAGTAHAVQLVADTAISGIDSGATLNGIASQGFSTSGRTLFLTLRAPAKAQPQLGTPRVDVWSYFDSALQSDQLNWPMYKPLSGLHTAALSVADGRIVLLVKGQPDERILSTDSISDDVVFVAQNTGTISEAYWNFANLPRLFRVSIRTGERQEVPVRGSSVSVSPDGKYVVAGVEEPGTTTSSQAVNHVISYELATGIIRNLTRSLAVPPGHDEYINFATQPWFRFGPRLEHDARVVVYDQYDIWLLDPTGVQPGINLTHGYGRRHGIIFRLTKEGYGNGRVATVSGGDWILLTAFDRTTKEMGFYRVQLRHPADPTRLTMGPYNYDGFAFPQGVAAEYDVRPLWKARDADVYLVMRGSATQAPNYFTTTDFRTFRPISAVYPEAAWNWVTTELLTWHLPDGRPVQGVLYKPENFDPAKRYPVIIHYYERWSHALHTYQQPGPMTASINIPWFVSNGYLVLTPDILYEKGQPGPSAYAAVVSGAKYLMTLPFVDSARLGLQGHSFGGYETNYIVAHTNLFAAAMSAAGLVDLPSGAVGLWGSGSSTLGLWEARNIGYSLWERPELYIENSPIFQARQVTTPLLIMHNKQDGAVPFAQGVEWFTALRRLGKRVWMLQYDDGDHVMNSDADKLDLTIRTTQFYDHYLKGAPAPKWMTRGIPAARKGFDDGLEYDLEIGTPGPGLPYEAEQAGPAHKSTRPQSQ